MKKHLLIILAASICAVVPAMAEEPTELNAEMSILQQQEVVIVAKGKSVRVIGAQNEMLRVYDITGQEVFAAQIDEKDQAFTIELKSGCYIVKVGKTARKITIR